MRRELVIGMALFTINNDKLEPVPLTTYAQEAILERKHLQLLLKNHISPLAPDLMVLCEEFSDWEDSSRRIDLLCLSKEANLVVVELKRTEDGGHMELQAVRYAAMVSSMTLDQAVAAHIVNGDAFLSCRRSAGEMFFSVVLRKLKMKCTARQRRSA